VFLAQFKTLLTNLQLINQNTTSQRDEDCPKSASTTATSKDTTSYNDAVFSVILIYLTFFQSFTLEQFVQDDCRPSANRYAIYDLGVFPLCE